MATHKSRGHWVRSRAGLKMGIFLVAHGASHSVVCPTGIVFHLHSKLQSFKNKSSRVYTTITPSIDFLYKLRSLLGALSRKKSWFAYINLV